MDVEVPRPSLARRTAEGLVSQGLASLSNFALVVVVARTSSPEAFGAFAIGYSAVQLLLLVGRSSIGGALAVTAAEARRGAVGAAVGLAAVTALVMAAAGLLWPQALLGRWLLFFSMALPLLAWQDAQRSAAFAIHRPRLAAISDLVWIVVQFGGWAGLAALGTAQPELVLGIWVGGAAAGALAIVVPIGVPNLRTSWAWLGRNRGLTSTFAIESLLPMGAAQTTMYALGLIAGLPAAGALQGAQTLLGPLRTLVAGVSSVALPEAATRRGAGITEVWRYAVRLSVWLAVLATAGTLVLVWLPETIGRQLLADTWPSASTILLPVGLTVILSGAMTGPLLGLRVLHATGALMPFRLAQAILLMIGGVGGAALRGLTGAAFGLAAAHVVLTPAAWLLFRRELAADGQGG